jgi:adenylate cyclase
MESQYNDEYFAQVALPRHDYYARALGYLAVAATLVVGYFNHVWGEYIIYILAFCFTYPSLAHLITITSTQWIPSRLLRTFFVHVDAVLCGLLIVYMDFALVPSLMFLIMINSSFVLMGRLTSWLFCVAWLLAGMLFGTFVMTYDLLRDIPDKVAIAAALGVAIQLSTAAYQAHRNAREFLRLKERFRIEEEKSRTLSLKIAKYISPQIWESIFSGKQQVELQAQRKPLVVFFSDIQGFTRLSDEIEPEELTDVLNQYLTDMSKIVLKYGGTIDKYIGDSIMVFFGDPTTLGLRKDAMACVSMAIEMRQHMKLLRQQWRAKGFTHNLEIRMGINAGPCNVGNFGTDNRMDYTIIGREVNLASRLESLAEAGDILISEDAYKLIQDKIMCREKGRLKVRGFTHLISVYQVIDFRKNLAEDSSFIQPSLANTSTYMDLASIKAWDRERVIQALDKASARLKSKKT